MAYVPLHSKEEFKISGQEKEHRLYFLKFPQNPKILLLEPHYPPEAAWGSLKVEQGYLTPLGSVSIYRWLQDKGYDVHFFDTQFGDYNSEELKKFLKQGQYDMIGLPVFTPTASYVFQTAKLIREALPDCIVVYGGVHATDMSAESMQESPECDFVIRREGELTMVELIEAMKAKETDFSGIEGLTWRQDAETIILNPDRALIPDLDQTPLGMFGDLDLTRYVPHPTQYIQLPSYSIFTQRGCPYPCTFCEASTALGKKLRVFSQARVIEELKILKYEKGARGIYFQDSTFTLNRKYVVDLFERMIKEGLNDLLWSCNTRTDRVDPELLSLMYEAGCRTITYGIESGNQQSLDVLKKNIKVEVQEEAVNWTHKARISLLCSYILCLPKETDDMVQTTIDYAKRLGSQMTLFYLPVPYPGSELYRICKSTGGLRETKDWSEYLSVDFDNPVYINPLIGKERMRYWYKKAYRDYYTCPRVWLNGVKSLIWNGGIHRYLRGFNAVQSLIFHKAS
jgi:anaerobic magnesium-protoporphyrin IX monomethyl ester cyclase